jgi:hypothetical protein
MRKVASILSMVFFLAVSSTIALADVVPGAALYLDARDNPAHPDAWANLGTAGGEIPAADDAPELLEEGNIEIPDLGFTFEDAMYYTTTDTLQSFTIQSLPGIPQPDTNPQMILGDWTLEMLARRNGDMYVEENAFCGFMPNESWEWGIFFTFHDEELWIIYGPEWEDRAGVESGLIFEEGVWTWIAVTSNDTEMIKYQDGEEIGKDTGRLFGDNPILVDGIAIFTGNFPERHRSFNGSIAIVRMYDKVLSADEIKGNIGAAAAAAVDPASKLTTTWGSIKGE